MPKISCIMTVYNTAKYLEECIDSILNQTYNDFEFIISDDGSTDWSKDIIKKYSEKDSRIIFIDNFKNRWIVDNLNDCLIKASWEYIAIMESDDISMPERFEIQIKFLNENENINLVWTWANIINENWDFLYKWESSTNLDYINKNIFKSIQFITPWILFKKNIINKIWYFKNWNVWDYDFYLETILNWFKWNNINKILISKRELKNWTLNKNYIKTIFKQLIIGFNKIIKYDKYNFNYYNQLLSKIILNLKSFIIIKIIIIFKYIWIYDMFSKIWKKYILKIIKK